MQSTRFIGNILETSIGIYTGLIGMNDHNHVQCNKHMIVPYTPLFFVGPPSIDAAMSGYTDLTSNSQTTALAQIECYTLNSPPTTVIWKKDGDIIDVEMDKYTAMQIVIDRRSSHYQNILLIRDVFNIMGNFTFTCEIENNAGSTHHSVNIDMAGNLLAS